VSGLIARSATGLAPDPVSTKAEAAAAITAAAATPARIPPGPASRNRRRVGPGLNASPEDPAGIEDSRGTAAGAGAGAGAEDITRTGAGEPAGARTEEPAGAEKPAGAGAGAGDITGNGTEGTTGT
jgi:hypothetical protein